MSIKINKELTTPNEQININTERACWTKWDEIPNVWHYTDFQPDGKVQYTTLQDPTDVLALNADLRKHSDENWCANETFKLAAMIPVVTFLEWQRLGITDDPKALLAAIKRHPELKATTKQL